MLADSDVASAGSVEPGSAVTADGNISMPPPLESAVATANGDEKSLRGADVPSPISIPVNNDLGTIDEIGHHKRPHDSSSSPRKSKRLKVVTPKVLEASQSPHAKPLAITSVHDLILTPSQALEKNQKLPYGYRLIPTGFLTYSSDAETLGKRVRRPTDRDASAIHKPSAGTPHVSAKVTRRVPTQEELVQEEKRKKIALLQKRLELLQQRQAAVQLDSQKSPALPTGALPSIVEGVPPTATLVHPKKSKTKNPVVLPSHSSNPPPPGPPTPAHSSIDNPIPLSSPSFSSGPPTPGDGKSSRSGRVVKAPKVFRADDTVQVKLSEPLRSCKMLLSVLMSQRFSHFFNEPVDIVKLGIPDYFNIIKQPMDLGTVKAQLSAGAYTHVDQLATDVRLVWSNAMLYNASNTLVHMMAQEYSALFEQKFSKIPKVAPPKAPKAHKNRLSSGVPGSGTKGGAGTPKNADGSVQKTLADLQKMMSAMNRKLDGRKPGDNTSTPRATKNLDAVPLTPHEKMTLKQNIFKLPSDKLEYLIEVCAQKNGLEDKNDESVTIDIDKLDIPTVRKLQAYVKKTMLELMPARKGTGQKGRTPKDSPGPSLAQGGSGRTPSPHISSPAFNELVSPRPAKSEEIPNPFLQNSFEAQAESESESDNSSSDSESSESEPEIKKPTAAPMIHAPYASSSSSSSYSTETSTPFGSASMYSAAPIHSQSQSGSSVPTQQPGLDVPQGFTTSDAWHSLGPDPSQTSSSANKDGFWKTFQSKEQEQRAKELEKSKIEAKMASEREREVEELRKRAEEARSRQEEETLRLLKEKEMEAARRDQELLAQREAARIARQNAETIDLGAQQMLMEMFE